MVSNATIWFVLVQAGFVYISRGHGSAFVSFWTCGYKLDTSRLSSITLQNARFSARGKVWDESGRGFRGSGTNNQRQTPCRALVGSRGLTLSRGRGNAHPEALLIRTCPQSIACIQIWASKRQTCYLMELHSLSWRSNNTFLVSWRYGRKHEHWKHWQTRTIHLKDDKESWKDRLAIFFYLPKVGSKSE